MLLFVLGSLTFEQQDLIVDIFEKKRKLLMSIAYKYVKNYDDVEDIISESFIKIIKIADKVEKSNNEGNLTAFCKSIVVNTAIDFYRKQKKYVNTEKIEDITDDSISAEKEVLNKLDIELIVDVLEILNIEDRKLINLRFNLDKEYKEIAKDLNLTEAATRKRGQRILVKLRKIISSKNGYEL